MAKQIYTYESFDSKLKKNIAMDYIDSISGQSDDLSEIDSLRSLFDGHASELNVISSDSLY